MVGREGALHVLDLLPDTPAAESELSVGDVITHINDRPVAERGCESLDEPQTMRLTVMRDGLELEVAVDVAVLVE
jgi:S1-C subfamily serine protease